LVLRQLIVDLCARAPLERDGSEVGALLAKNAHEWPGRDTLLSRPDAYTRTCVYRHERFELLLLNWARGASSAIHDHGDRHCWMMVLDGVLEVDDYVRLDAGDLPGYAHVEPRGSRRLEPGEMDLRSGRYDLHRVAARSGTAAVSLHLYAGPLRRFFVYDEAAQRCEPAFGAYDDVRTFRDELIPQ
jgi:predicted metal-dependent enzyme (double-stranded beta helix superfamily)